MHEKAPDFSWAMNLGLRALKPRRGRAQLGNDTQPNKRNDDPGCEDLMFRSLGFNKTSQLKVTSMLEMHRKGTMLWH